MNAQQRKQKRDEREREEAARIEAAITVERERLEAEAYGRIQAADALRYEAEEVARQRAVMLERLDAEVDELRMAGNAESDRRIAAETALAALRKELDEAEERADETRREMDKLRAQDSDAARLRRRLAERTQELDSANARIRKLEQAAQAPPPTVMGRIDAVKRLVEESPLGWNNGKVIISKRSSERDVISWLKMLRSLVGLGQEQPAVPEAVGTEKEA